MQIVDHLFEGLLCEHLDIIYLTLIFNASLSSLGFDRIIVQHQGITDKRIPYIVPCNPGVFVFRDRALPDLRITALLTISIVLYNLCHAEYS